MVHLLYTLKSEYKNKKIYIWDVNRDSITLLTKAVFRRINIRGFVTLQSEYAGEIYMNRPVITLEQALQEEDGLILVSDEVMKYRGDVLPTDKTVCWSEALECDEELRQKKVIIYGTGWGARQLEKTLSKEGVEAELYCVTKKNGDTLKYQGKTVIEVSQLDSYEDYAVIVSVVIGNDRQEILETLSTFQGQIYVERVIGEVELLHINLIQSIDAAIKRQNRIYLYSKRNAISGLIEEVLRIYGVQVSGYVYDTQEDVHHIESIYSLAYEGVEDKLIIINEESPERLVKARENIEFAGFSLEQGNYTGLQWYTLAKEDLLSQSRGCYDSLVGHSRLYSQDKPGTKSYGKPGWKLYGREEKERIRIMVLGGSTSAEMWHPENWVSKLYDRLEHENIKTVIYNGAHEGNDIVDEMLRFLRDAYVLRPQIVICMSGVNNTAYKESPNLFNEAYMIEWVKNFAPDMEYCGGVPSDETVYSFWSRNIRLLGVIAAFYGARFWGFLQPINITIQNKTLREKSLYELEEHMVGAEEFAQFACDGEGYINLMHLFNQQDEMYFDVCHYTDKAHEVIADIVYKEIQSEIKAIAKAK